MTDQQEQIEQHVEAEQQAEQQAQAQAAQEEQQAPERSQEELLRDAVAANFISHCVNGRAAECQEHQADPRIVGGVDAVATVVAQVINMAGEEGIEQQFKAVIDGLDLLTVNGAPVLQLIVSAVIARAAEQGTAFGMLGELQGMAMKVMMNGAMNQVYSACAQQMAAGAPDPMKPFAPMAESAPVAGDGQGEELPEQSQQDLDVARKQVEKGEVKQSPRRPKLTRHRANGNRHRR